MRLIRREEETHGDPAHHDSAADEKQQTEFVTGYAFGSTQERLNHLAESVSLPADELTERVAALLSGASGRQVLRPADHVSNVRGHARPGSPLLEPLALAGGTHGDSTSSVTKAKRGGAPPDEVIAPRKRYMLKQIAKHPTGISVADLAKKTSGKFPDATYQKTYMMLRTLDKQGEVRMVRNGEAVFAYPTGKSASKASTAVKHGGATKKNEEREQRALEIVRQQPEMTPNQLMKALKPSFPDHSQGALYHAIRSMVRRGTLTTEGGTFHSKAKLVAVEKPAPPAGANGATTWEDRKPPMAATA